MKNILIVEDEAVIASWLRTIVNSIDDSINVFTTGYAAKALTISMENCIDMFMIDIQLKDYSGFDLAKQL
jgi:two-component system LytT family response regulator